MRSFGGHRVILGAPGVPKPNNKAISPKDMIVDINKSIMSKANPNKVMYSWNIKDQR